MSQKLHTDLMQEIMNGNESFLKTLFITEEQKELIRQISGMDYMTTNDLAQRRNISSQNASAKLKRLFVAGYLQRTTRSSETGGIEHRYTAKYKTETVRAGSSS